MDIPPLLSTIALYVWRAFCIYASSILLFALPAVYQEHKIWARSSALPSLNLFGYIKVYLLNVCWMGAGLLGSMLLFPKWLVLGMGRSVEREANVMIERNIGLMLVRLWLGPVVVNGTQNLPPDDDDSPVPAPVYIANHSSMIDVGVVYYIRRRFKWISKKSVQAIPGVGQIMSLSHHVFIDRKTGQNKNSVSNLYAKSNAAVQAGIPMFIFPQGTRRMSERLPFKDGAFNIALKNASPIIPISIGIPMSAWNDAYPFSLLWGATTEPIVITVHEPIVVNGTEDKEALKERCFDIIYSVLPDYSEPASAAKAEDKKKQ